jgi:hypothetical protein
MTAGTNLRQLVSRNPEDSECPPTYLILSCALLGGFADSGICQIATKTGRDRRKSGSVSRCGAVPCKVKTRGKAKMLHWQQVDECLNGANDRIDKTSPGKSRSLAKAADPPESTFPRPLNPLCPLVPFPSIRFF